VDFDTAFGLVRPLRNLILLHELRHLNVEARLRKRTPYPFYGRLCVLEGRLTGEANPDAPCCGPTLYFEECETCRDMVRQRATRFLGRLTWAKHIAEQRTEAERLVWDFANGYLLTDPVHCGIRHVIRHLHSQGDGVVYDTASDGIPRAMMTGVTTPTGVLEVHVPLVGADVEDSPSEKRRHLERQLAAAQTEARLYLSSYERVMGGLKWTRQLQALIRDDPAALRDFARAVRVAFRKVRYGPH
jgi:hypothetical protein